MELTARKITWGGEITCLLIYIYILRKVEKKSKIWWIHYECFSYNNFFQDSKFMKCVVKITMDVWWNHRRKESEGPELVRSDIIKNLPIFSSRNFCSSAWFMKLPWTSRLISLSRVQLWWLWRRPVRLTWLVFSKIPTWVPSKPSMSLSCLRTSRLLAISMESGLKIFCGCLWYNNYCHRKWTWWH